MRNNSVKKRAWPWQRNKPKRKKRHQSLYEVETVTVPQEPTASEWHNVTVETTANGNGRVANPVNGNVTAVNPPPPEPQKRAYEL